MAHKILIFILCIPFFAQAQYITLIDSITQKPIPSVILENEKGIVIAVSDEKGQLNIDALESVIFTSHLSYKPKKLNKNSLKNNENIFLSVKEYELSEVMVQAESYDYTLLKTYFRTYQYADSIPIYYTEGYVNFYIPKKRNNLKWNIVSMKVYENTKSEKLKSLKKGSVFMKDNGITNFIEHSLFPLQKNYTLVKKSNDQYAIAYHNKEGAGYIEKRNGGYSCYLNKLFPEGVFKGSFAGRTNVISINNIYQEFPSNVDIENLNPTDFTLYRCLRHIETTRKKETLALINIFELYPFEKYGVNKADLKDIRLENFSGNLENSVNIADFDKQNIKIPSISSIFEILLEKELILLPEKNK